MNKKEIKERIKELGKMYDKTKNIGEKIKINREIIYFEMQLERIIDNETI